MRNPFAASRRYRLRSTHQLIADALSSRTRWMNLARSRAFDPDHADPDYIARCIAGARSANHQIIALRQLLRLERAEARRYARQEGRTHG